MGPADQRIVALGHPRREAQPVEGQEDGRAIEEAHDQRLAVHGGHGRDADVHPPAARRHADASILGKTALRDVHLRHELDARGEGGPELARGRLPIVEDAVHTVAHAQLLLERLHVDVRSLGGHRLLDQEIDEADHGSLEGHVAQVIDVFLGLSGLTGADAFYDFLQWGRRAVGSLDRLEDGGSRRDTEGDVAAEGLPQVIEKERIGGIGGGHRHRSAIESDGAGHVLSQVLGRKILDDGRRARQLFRGNEGQPALQGERPQHVFRRGCAHGDQRLAELLAILLRLPERVKEDVLGEDAGLEQYLPQPLDQAW